MDSKQKFFEEKVKKLLEILEIKAKVKAATSEERVFLNLEGKDLGALVGFRGETLKAIQLFLTLASYRKFNEWSPVTLDINNYCKDQEEKLKDIARNTATKVRFNLKPIELFPMSSYDRKIIHEEVSTIKGVVSESVGEGYNRRVVIKPN